MRLGDLWLMAMKFIHWKHYTFKKYAWNWLHLIFVCSGKCSHSIRFQSLSNFARYVTIVDSSLLHTVLVSDRTFMRIICMQLSRQHWNHFNSWANTLARYRNFWRLSSEGRQTRQIKLKWYLLWYSLVRNALW